MHKKCRLCRVFFCDLEDFVDAFLVADVALHGEDLALVERGNDVRFKVDGKDFVVALHKKFQCFETDTAVCAGQNDFLPVIINVLHIILIIT